MSSTVYEGVSPERLAEIDAIVEEMKTHPAFMDEFDPNKPMSAAMEGLIALKYDADNEGSASSYKDDGNFNFKMKKYRWAIDAYTEGIKLRCRDRQLNAILHSNRAACHFRIGNFRTAWKDCTVALIFKPDHMKAILKGAECCWSLRRYAEIPSWCNMGLALGGENTRLTELMTISKRLEKERLRDERREKQKQAKAKISHNHLLDVIKSRGVKVVNNDVLKHVDAHLPSDAIVSLDEDGALSWPVLFMYPEHAQTDFIEAFHETSLFADHLAVIFAEHPPWDAARKYEPSSLTLYFEPTGSQELHHIDTQSSLFEALTHKRYVMAAGGVPSFIVVPANTDFERRFLKLYTVHSTESSMQ